MVQIGLVVSDENEEITSKMEIQAREVANGEGLIIESTHHAPSVFDIPFISHQMVLHEDVDIIVVLGSLVQGDTKRDRVLGHQVVRTLLQLGISTGTPISSGIAGPDMDTQEAFDRINYGRVAMERALDLIDEVENIQNN